MDRIRPRQGKTSRRNLMIWGGILGALTITVWTISSIDLRAKRIGADEVRLGTVERRDMVIDVTANGTLVPREVEWISAQVEGRVSAIHKQAGEQVEIGDQLVELTNISLTSSAEEARAALAGGEAAYISYEVDLQNEILNQQALTLRAKFAYESAELRLDAETRLKESSNVIAEIDYRRTQLEVEQLKASYEIESRRLAKSQSNIAMQLEARKAQVEQLRRALVRAENKVESLLVRAGMKGIVQRMDLEIGQSLEPGDQIALIAQESNLFAELRVLAREVTDIAPGQRAVVDTRNGTVIGRVSRVDPEVREGTVLVDVELTGPLPRGARPELRVEGTITVTRIENTLVIPVPSYGRANSLLSLFRVTKDGNQAERIQVTTGRRSTKELQVLDGLTIGDSIILSDTTEWQDYNRVYID